MTDAIVLSKMGYKSTKGKRIFTYEEGEWLKENYHKLSYRQMADKLCTSKTSVCLFSQRLGLGKKNPIYNEIPQKKEEYFDVMECHEKSWIA